MGEKEGIDSLSELEQPLPRREVRREWWVILALVGVFLVGVPALFALPAGRILFDPASYKQALADENAYQQFPRLVGEAVEQGGNTFLFGSGGRLLEALQRSNYQAVLEQIFPESWVRRQAEGLIDQLWDYMNFQTSNLSLVVELQPVKTRLQGESAAGIAATIVQGLPGCTGKELLDFSLQALKGTLGELPLCRPPDALVGVANKLVEGILNASAATIPDQVDLAAGLRLPAALGGAQVSTAFTRLFRAYHFFRQISPWLPWLALLLLGLAGYLALDTERGVLYWLGVGILVPGLVTAMFALMGQVWIHQVLPGAAGGIIPWYAILFGMLERVLGQYLWVVAGISAGFALAGLVLLVVSVYADRSSTKTTEE